MMHLDIRIFGLTEDSIVDGPGLRLAVFAQGCARTCEGCHNPGSKPLDGGTLMRTEQILAKLRANPLQAGVTLSGGEPFLQPEACRALAEGARALGKSVWIYTGYTWEELLEARDPAHIALLEACDVLVDGLFVLEERTMELPFRGSRNQRLIDVRASLDAGEIVPHEIPIWVNAQPPA